MSQQTFDFENELKKAFYTLREIPDRENKLESIKADLMEYINQAQNGKFDVNQIPEGYHCNGCNVEISKSQFLENNLCGPCLRGEND